MNWVGGTRLRVLSKNDPKRREYFEKIKREQGLVNQGPPLPKSEVTNASSMDPLSLFIAKQASVKKVKKEHDTMIIKRVAGKAMPNWTGNGRLAQPVKLCSLSNLSLPGTLPVHSQTRKRKYVPQLSPVIESEFSDYSASDYAEDAHSSVSNSLANIGQRGQLLLQPNHQQSSELKPEPASHYSKLFGRSGFNTDLPYAGLELKRNVVQYRSLFASGASGSAYRQTPSAALVLLESSRKAKRIANVNPLCSAALSPLKYKVPVPDSIVRQSKKHFEDNLLRSVNNRELNNKHLTPEEGVVKSKLHFKENIPIKPTKPQTFPETQSIELPSCARTSSAGPRQSSTIWGEDQHSSGCFISHSTNDEKQCYCGHCKTSSTMNIYAVPNQSSFGIYGQMLPLMSTPVDKLNTNNDPQRVSQPTPLYHLPLRPTQPKCWTKCTKTHEIGTQTDNPSTNEMCDFGVQCGLMPAPPLIHFSCPAFETLMQYLSTRGQTLHSDDKARSGPKTSSGMTQNIQENCSHYGNINQTFTSSGDRILIEFRAKQSGEKWHQESTPVLKNHQGEVVTSEAKANTVHSEDAQALQEIGEILLRLNQKDGAR